jgi:hypothetical protein
VPSAAENIEAHSIDPHSVDGATATHAPLDATVPHYQAYEDAAATRAEATAANDAAKTARDELWQDLHDNHGLAMGKTDLRSPDATTQIRGFAAKVNEPAVKEQLLQLQDAIRRYRITQRNLTHASETLGAAGGDDALRAMGMEPAGGGVGVGKGSFDKFAVSPGRSEVVVLEEKGGGASLSQSGRLLPDGTRAAQGSTDYFMDVAKHDSAFQEFLSHPENTDIAQGLKDGSVTPRYILSRSPGDGLTLLEDLLLNPDRLDWSWLL